MARRCAYASTTAQKKYDALDTDTGEVRTGQIRPANRGTVRAFLLRLAAKETVVAVEAMTGWRRAKTDKLDARLLRELLMQERLPESWIAPAHSTWARR